MSQYFLIPPQETILSLPNLLIFLVSPLLVIWLLSKRFKALILSNKSPPPLPPGPFHWPIVGNIFQIGSNPHQSLARLAKTYGPLMSLKLGSTIVIVGSSPDAAMEILKTRDCNLSLRMFPRCHHLSAKRKFKTARSDGLKSATIVGSTCGILVEPSFFRGKP